MKQSTCDHLCSVTVILTVTSQNHDCWTTTTGSSGLNHCLYANAPKLTTQAHCSALSERLRFEMGVHTAGRSAGHGYRVMSLHFLLFFFFTSVEAKWSSNDTSEHWSFLATINNLRKHDGPKNLTQILIILPFPPQPKQSNKGQTRSEENAKSGYINSADSRRPDTTHDLQSSCWEDTSVLKGFSTTTNGSVDN